MTVPQFLAQGTCLPHKIQQPSAHVRAPRAESSSNNASGSLLYHGGVSNLPSGSW